MDKNKRVGQDEESEAHKHGLLILTANKWVRFRSQSVLEWEEKWQYSVSTVERKRVH